MSVHGKLPSVVLTGNYQFAHAVTGAVCVATACVLDGSIAHEVARADGANPRTVWIEHPSGMIDVRLTTEGTGADMTVVAGTLRTARPIMRGEVLVPTALLEPWRH